MTQRKPVAGDGPASTSPSAVYGPAYEPSGSNGDDATTAAVRSNDGVNRGGNPEVGTRHRPNSPVPEPAPSAPHHDQPRWLHGDDEDVPVRPALTRRRIVMTALKLVEQHGLDALTMRRVASALKVTPMSLYNHVADKAELVDLMVDFIIGDVVAQSADDQGDWEAKLRAQAKRNHEIWRRHPGVVRVYAEGVTLGPNGLANMDWAIGLLLEAGFDEKDAAAAFLLLYRWSMATLLVGRTRPVSRSYEQVPPNVSASRTDRMRALFSARPLHEVPNIEATMMYLSGTSIDFGLDVIMAGLKARLAAQDWPGAHGTVDRKVDDEVNPKTDGKVSG